MSPLQGNMKKRHGKTGGRLYRWCFVPNCSNTTVTNPELLFVPVPGCPKERIRWYKSARRDGTKASGALWACEDHFDVPNDLENYYYVKMMGGVLKIKQGVIPHKFACQCRGIASPQVLQKRNALQRKRKLQEMLDVNVDGTEEEGERSLLRHAPWELKIHVVFFAMYVGNACAA